MLTRVYCWLLLLSLVIHCQTVETMSYSDSISFDQLDGAGQRGSEQVDQAVQFELQLIEQHPDEILLQEDSPSYLHQQLSRSTLESNSVILMMARDALRVIQASRHLQLEYIHSLLHI